MSSENQTFMEKYHSLPFLEKKILQILSISYARLTQTQLLACLVALDIKTEDGESFDSGTRNAMLKLLRKSAGCSSQHGYIARKNPQFPVYQPRLYRSSDQTPCC